MPLQNIDFDALRAFNFTLYVRAARAANLTESVPKGVHPVDTSKLYWEDQKELNVFVEEQAIKARAEREDAEARQREIDAETAREHEAEAERQRKTDADISAAKARLMQYIEEQSLEDTAANGTAIRQWIADHASGYMAPQNVDAAIKMLGPRGRNVLTWKPKTPAVTPAPAQSETIRLLSNGEPELPLDAGESQMRAASVQQLKDLSKRRGEGRNLRQRDGWTGASL